MFSLHVDTGRTWRGGQIQVMHTVLGLRSIGERAAVVAHPNGVLIQRLAEGPDVIPLAPTHEVDLGAAWRLSRVIKRLRPDLVHAHDPHAVAMAATALSIASPAPRIPLVAARRLELRMARNSFSRWKYSQVDCFIASTRVVAERLAQDGIRRDRIVVVNEGVDVERIERLSPARVHAEFYLPTQAPGVGNVAALVPHKGHQHLIEAAALVVRAVPDVRFVIVGDGEMRESLEQQIHHHHLERHVFLAGFRPDAVELTKAFDLFVMSSLTEGMCTPLVDAMAAGRAVVATAVGGIPEVVVDGVTGVLVPPRNPQRFAHEVIRLLNDGSLRSRMGAAAARLARERFTVEQMVAGTAAVYRSLAGGTANRAAAG
jgi:glycosyltransferase involved in cell wall biosynthesis